MMRRIVVQRYSGRKQQGAGFLILTLLTAVFVILPAGLLAFELMRYNLICQELRNVTDAAALAGSATISSAPKNLNLPAIHDLAIQTAAVTFEQNSVGTTRFNPDNVDVRPYELDPGPPVHAHEAVLCISLQDNAGNWQPRGSIKVKRVQVQSAYKEEPAFAQFLHLSPTFVVNAVAVGGLPILDLFICFDLSGSMDDQTQASVMKRYWNAKSHMVDYKVLKSDTIYNLFNPPSTGTAVNCMWPQNLSYGSYGGQEGNSSPWIWSEGPTPSPNKMNKLRSGLIPSPVPDTSFTAKVIEQGKPPGNYDPGDPDNQKGNKVDPDAYSNGFTDLVLKVQDSGGFTYPNLQTCLEASRGNLEDQKTFDSSKGGQSAKTNPALQGVKPKAGYYKNYWIQVQESAEPFNDAKAALLRFMAAVNQSADAHFGLETFADNAGQSEADFWPTTPHKVDTHYRWGASDTYPIPLLDLNLRASRYEDIYAVFEGSGVGNPFGSEIHRLALGPTGKTNIPIALKMGIQQLTDPNKSRSFAKKAIILFTDGVANEPYDIQSASSFSLKMARMAHDKGIPIFTIGLSQNPNVKPLEDELLGDGNNGSGRGIAYESGNHAVYIPVTAGKDLSEAFHAIARCLAVLREHK